MSLYRYRNSMSVTSWVAVAAMSIQPQLLFADQPVVGQPLITESRSTVSQDIALQKGGVLQGHVVDAQGTPLAMTPVSLRTGGEQVARIHTDSEGNFHVAELMGGTYEVATDGQQGVYRLWAPNTAPPSALDGLTVVSGEDVLRGKYAPAPGGPFTAAGQWIAEHPIITAGIIATAIAVPIALSNDKKKSPPATP